MLSRKISKYLVTLTHFYVISGQECRKSILGYVAFKLMPVWLATIMFKTGLVHWMTNFFKFSKRTVSEVLSELTSNKDLQTVLAYNFGDYGMSFIFIG